MAIKLTLVQPITHRPPDDGLNVDEAVGHVRGAALRGSELVVFPESYPGPWRMPPEFDAVGPLRKVAEECGVYVQFGTLEPTGGGGKSAYQLAVLAYPDGREPGIYRRTHPPGPWLYTGGGDWDFQYVEGGEFPVFPTVHGVVGMAVCSEVYVPEVARALALQGAEILLFPAGVQKASLWETWRNLIWARAIENLAVVITTQNLFEPGGLGLAMVASAERVLLEAAVPGVFDVEVSLDGIRRLRRERDGVGSRDAAKAGLLSQWRREDLQGVPPPGVYVGPRG